MTAARLSLRQPACRAAVGFAAILALLSVPPVKADMQELMDEQFTALTNFTGPASYQTARRGVLAGGSAYARVPIMNDKLVSLVPPSFEAGCGGIDFFSGSFSFINADQFLPRLHHDVGQQPRHRRQQELAHVRRRLEGHQPHQLGGARAQHHGLDDAPVVRHAQPH